jgi:pimeloyl-ACP methyl ester carboxylesterase
VIALVVALALAPKPTVVLVHGAGGGGWEWDKWRAPFAQAGWRFVAPDLVPTKGGLAKTTLDDYVRQVVGWCPKEGPVVLVGASMGGLLALKAAERVRPAAVVLVNAVPPGGTGGKTYPEIVRWANGPLKDTRDSMPDSDEKTIQFAWKRWRDESGGVMTALSRGVPVARPTCPVLVVIGQNDTDIAPTKSRATAAAYDADVLEYAGMSHVGPLLGTRGPEVASTVLAWSRGALRRSPAQ